MAFSREKLTVTDCDRLWKVSGMEPCMHGMWGQQRFWRMPQEKTRKNTSGSKGTLQGTAMPA